MRLCEFISQLFICELTLRLLMSYIYIYMTLVELLVILFHVREVEVSSLGKTVLI